MEYNMDMHTAVRCMQQTAADVADVCHNGSYWVAVTHAGFARGGGKTPLEAYNHAVATAIACSLSRSL